MIRPFGTEDTASIQHERHVRRVDPTAQRAALRTLEPIHPGEVLREDVIGGFGDTQNTPAVSIGVPPRRIDEIVHGSRGIAA